MRIPRRHLDKFVREIANQCMSSRTSRRNRSAMYESYFSAGTSDPANPAMFNKIFSSLDDLESLLYSPVSLRFHIGDPDLPNIATEAKCRTGASKIRNLYRQSDADSLLSQCVQSSLVKGLGILKQTMKKGELKPELVDPDSFGVMHENHTKLDEDMEAFNYSRLITTHKFYRMIAGRPDEDELRKKAKRYMRETKGDRPDTRGSAMNIVVGGLYPLQAAGQGISQARGVVDWMTQPKPDLSPDVEATFLDLDETWVFDDQREDWTTFTSIGDDILIDGRYHLFNKLNYDPETRVSAPHLIGVHPYTTFCVNPVPGYFWGMSEIARLMLLQEGINARIVGTNKMLRKQEEPSTKFVGSSGVNQLALSRFNKPGGYYTDTNPNAKIERDTVTIPQDLWSSLHEYERMFDDMMGVPPVAKGHGEKGVRSANHAEALVRMFSPRFKDRALLVERSVEASGALTLDLARAAIDKRLVAWVPGDAAGIETDATPEELKILVPPAKGMVPIYFTFADLPDDVTLTVDAHSSSPAFSQEHKGLVFDALKTGLMGPEEAVDQLDLGADAAELQMGIARRAIAKAEAEQKKEEVKLLSHSGKK